MRKKNNIFTNKFISILDHFRHGIFKLSIVTFIFYSHQSMAYKPEKGRVSASTGPFLFQSDVQREEENFYPKPRLGYSLMAEAIISKRAGVEIGLFYMNKHYLRNDGTNFIIQKTTRMYITTSYRYWLSNYFSTALGIFSSFTMGDPTTLEKTPGLPDDFRTSAESVANYGLDLSLRFEYEFDKKNGLNFDIRYSYAWTEQDNELLNHVLAGLFYRRQIDIQ